MAKNRITLGGEIKNALTRDLVQALSTLGYYAMMHAYGEHSFNHRTRNLHDSYASAVYVNGQLIERSIRRVGGELSTRSDRHTGLTGRETVNRFLQTNAKAYTGQDIVLIVVAAMFYADILESGTSKMGKYVVISPATDYIERGWWAAVYKVYDKYGIESAPNAKVIKGSSLV